ncbi:MAG TPA: alpha/beta fold hydrolase [Candidatus Limnocylindrales bacterium]|nr:alpha/beta fold hydrolase [Candidatus Limnocylindrales bacterium]
MATVRAALPVIELANVTTLPDGRQVEWEAVGEGEPLLWIEGGPGLPAHLARPDVSLLARMGFRAYLVNAPGCGRSSAPMNRDGYTLEAHVDYFEAARRAVIDEPVTIVGHSWGGLVAAAHAATYPDAVQRLIIIDGYAGGDSVDHAEADAERQRAIERHRGRPWFADAVAGLERAFAMTRYTEPEFADAFWPVWPLYFAEPDAPQSADHISRVRREVRWNVDVSIVWNERYEAADRRDLLARVSAPTLVVVGEHDFICGPTWARALAASIPGATLVEMPGVGHVPPYEDERGFVDVVSSWRARTGS